MNLKFESQNFLIKEKVLGFFCLGIIQSDFQGGKGMVLVFVF